MSNYRYGIVGTGAVGGFYGARLQKSGRDVHFLLRSDGDYVKENGLVIESKDGDFNLPQVHAYSNVLEMPKCDVVIVALKTTQNHVLPNILPHLLKDDGVVLVLQNGVGSEVEIAAIVGEDKVIGCIASICCNKVGPGHIVHLDYGRLVLAPYLNNYKPGKVTPKMTEIAEDFSAAGIPVELTNNLILVRWSKLVWNVPYNGLSVVLNATTAELMSNSDTKTLIINLMQEVIAGGKNCYCFIPNAFIDMMLEHTEKMVPYRTSMKVDYDQKRPLEIEAIFGKPLSMAKAAGNHLPLIEMLYQQLKFINARMGG